MKKPPGVTPGVKESNYKSTKETGTYTSESSVGYTRQTRKPLTPSSITTLLMVLMRKRRVV